jgi:hypothetical protein
MEVMTDTHFNVQRCHDKGLVAQAGIDHTFHGVPLASTSKPSAW